MSRQLDRGRETLMDIFHRHQQANEQDAAASVLERALQVAAYRPEALVWKGIAALPQTPKLAFIFFAEAAQALPKRADIHALVGRSLLAQGNPALATRYLTHAWKTQPNDLGLRLTLWEARSQSETSAELSRMILAHLPDINVGRELGFVLKLLAAQDSAPRTVGVVRYVPEHKEIQGWAIDLQNLQTPVTLQIEVDGKRVSMVANAIHPLLKAASLPETHGGIRISVPNPTPAVHILSANNAPLLGSPVYAMPAFVPPAPASKVNGKKNPVDVLIPVYDGLKETLDCLNSALEARKLNRTPHRLVVIEDKTPIPALAKALEALASKGKIVLVQNKVNLGFIRSMNRAMALSPIKDVVWLNADTRVHGAWLDRLHTVAYSASDIASVTPLTNNGELMSFPRSQICHDMPDAKAHAELDELARQLGCAPVEIETGCGFCLYIKRAALDEVGYLDEIHLSRGYGEETDWCLRAREHGWRHMGAPNVFVAHQGGISFGAEKIVRVAQNNAILRQRYPDASARYKAFCLRDPIKSARQILQEARLELFDKKSRDAKNESWPFDIERKLHIHDGSHVGFKFSLSYHHDSHRTWVVLSAPLQPLPLILEFELPQQFDRLIEAIRKLQPHSINFEKATLCPVILRNVPSSLNIPYQILSNDDRAIENEQDHELNTFIAKADSVYIPWNDQKALHEQSFPGIRLASIEIPVQSDNSNIVSKVILIGDELDGAEIENRWLKLVKRIKCEGLSIKLIAIADTPALRSLKVTGMVYDLPEIHEFSITERIHAAGCTAILSLAKDPYGAWQAQTLADQLNLQQLSCAGLLKDDVEEIELTSLLFE